VPSRFLKQTAVASGDGLLVWRLREQGVRLLPSGTTHWRIESCEVVISTLRVLQDSAMLMILRFRERDHFVLIVLVL